VYAKVELGAASDAVNADIFQFWFAVSPEPPHPLVRSTENATSAIEKTTVNFLRISTIILISLTSL
jgi:hypothetical protein